MAAEQTILFTVTPRGIGVGGDTLPVSVYVAPRLRGPDRLGAYPDWQLWTRRVKEAGLALELRCGGGSLELGVETEPLQPRLWEALFKEDTLVCSHEFDDYSDRPVLSYPVRQTLGALKSIYQEAAVELALPDRPRVGRARHDRGNRGALRDLLEGLDVHWNGRDGERWRAVLRRAQRAERERFAGNAVSAAQLDRDGLMAGPPDAARSRAAALPFAVFHHMPTPDRDELDPDWDTELDFHQALGSLDSYPALQRALGIVFDLELPRDFVPLTPSGAFERLSIGAAAPGWDWAVPTDTPELSTACLHLELEDRRKVFFAAPRALDDPASPTQVIGLLDLDPARFGLAQVDVDGGMHKAIMLAETWHNSGQGRNLESNARPEPAPHPEVFDPEATLPSLRSGGFSLFADRRAQQLLDTMRQSKAFNDAVASGGAQPRPFFAEDLVRGYRLDVWDSRTGRWHSLHLRDAEYAIEGETFDSAAEEGFVQLAATQPAKGAQPASDDLYLHEAIARWAGWSLSVEMPGKHLSRHADPLKAVPPDGDHPDYRVNEPKTPFKLTPSFEVVAGSLPRLRFGSRYRIRARAVDLAGNSLQLDRPITDALSAAMAIPRDPEGFAYLRYEPVAAPLVVLRDPRSVTDRGSAVDRLVIRTFNDGESEDAAPADLTAADRHLVPPRTSVELGERLRMFDTESGELRSDAATWKLVAERDAGELRHAAIDVAGNVSDHPLEPAARIDVLPYLPDPLSHGAALRDLPGTPSGTIGYAGPGGASAKVGYDALADPNPRPGSVTVVDFPDTGDWQETKGFRLALAEPAADDVDPRPSWDPEGRVLTVYLPKGHMTTVPLSSHLRSSDLPLMGQWQWLREHLDRIAVTEPRREQLLRGGDVDRIAHVLQRAVEGGHWLLTPPRLLTLVHAVQRPLRAPEFTAFDTEHGPAPAHVRDPLQTVPIAGRRDPTELAPITAWRRPGATDAYLMGGLRLHGASTAKVDLRAAWDDPVDDVSQPRWTTAHHEAYADEVPLHELSEWYLEASGPDRRRVGYYGPDRRRVGYYDPEHDQIGFVRAGDRIGRPGRNELTFVDAAPRHLLNDTKHHRVAYTAVATSRYREYFPPELGLTRESAPLVVDVPASARPLAPGAAYVVPTFGWQRQTETNVMRSVRLGGGLRVYLRRPWFSSGEGELLGVALWSSQNGTLDRNRLKPFITQWGMDPIWETGELSGVPAVSDFPDAVAWDRGVTLEEPTAAAPGGGAGHVDVVGFEPEYDEARGMWFADLTVNTPNETYMPFVRLALVRYQPNALVDAKVSRVVLADFAQLTPDRAATVTCDPYHPRRLNVAISGVAPRGPAPGLGERPTRIHVRVQQRDESLASDLAWRDAAPEVANVSTSADGPLAARPDLVLWAGAVSFAADPRPGQFRLLVEEHERVDAHPGRLIYAETFELDRALLR